MKLLTIIISLIFLYSCSEKIDEAYVSVNLPGNDQKETKNLGFTVSIYVYQDSYKYLGEVISLEQIEKVLKELKDTERGCTINVKIDERVNIKERVTSLLSIINKVGIDTFNLHTIKSKEKTEPEGAP